MTDINYIHNRKQNCLNLAGLLLTLYKKYNP